jgi:hypothetical protein
MKKFSIGDEVTVLDEAFNGRVSGFKNGKVLIETAEGFTLEFEENELVKTHNSKELTSFISSQSLGSVLREKEEPKKRTFVKEKKTRKDSVVLEIDLHIEKLVPNKRGLSNYDILTIQSDAAKRQLEFAIRNKIQKVVFIHGVGEGVLKSELDFMFGRYEGITFGDADYQKYGLGATEIYIKQNPNR